MQIRSRPKTASKLTAALLTVLLTLPVLAASPAAAAPADLWVGARQIETVANAAAGKQWVAVTDEGRAYAVWGQSEGAVQGIYAAIVDGDSTLGPYLIDAGAGDAYYPRVATDTRGNALFVWMQWNGTRFDIASRWYITGYGWKPVEWAGRGSFGHAYFPSVAVDGDGNGYLGWIDYNASNGTGLIKVQRWTPSGGWGPATRLGAFTPIVNFAVAVGADLAGGWASWVDSTGSYYHLMTSRWAGSWSAPLQMDNATYGVSAFSMAVSRPYGSVMLGWVGNDNGAANIAHARLYTPTSSWGPDTTLSAAPNGASSPWAAVDNMGGGSVAYMRSDGMRTRIYVAIWDPLTGWAGAAAVTPAAENADYPRQVMDATGDILLTFHVFTGSLYRMNVTRYTVGLGWTTAISIQDASFLNWVDSPIPASTPSGATTVIWTQYDAASNVWINTMQPGDRAAPRLRIDTPLNGSLSRDPATWLSGRSEPGATVRVNGVLAAVLPNGTFGLWYPLENGSNLLQVTASDGAGNEATANVWVLYDDPDRWRIEELEAQAADLWTALASQNASLFAELAAQNTSLLGAVADLNASLLASMVAADADLAQLVADTNLSLLVELAALNSDLASDIAALNASLLADLAAQNSALLDALAQTNAALLAELAAQNSALLDTIALTNSSLLAQLAAQNSALLDALALTNASLLAQLAAQDASLLARLAATNSSLLASLAAQDAGLRNLIATTNASLLRDLAALNSTLKQAVADEAAQQQAALSGTNASLAETQDDLAAAQEALAAANTMATVAAIIAVAGVALAALASALARRRPPLPPVGPGEAPLAPATPGGTGPLDAEVPASKPSGRHGHSMASEGEVAGDAETEA